MIFGYSGEGDDVLNFEKNWLHVSVGEGFV